MISLKTFLNLARPFDFFLVLIQEAVLPRASLILEEGLSHNALEPPLIQVYLPSAKISEAFISNDLTEGELLNASAQVGNEKISLYRCIWYQALLARYCDSPIRHQAIYSLIQKGHDERAHHCSPISSHVDQAEKKETLEMRKYNYQHTIIVLNR